MSTRTIRALGGAIVAGALVFATPLAASAHEERKQGDLEMTVGFGTEPAYVGQPNSVQIILAHDGKPVTDLGDTLTAEVSFGDQAAMEVPLEPYFEIGEFGTPGDYRGWFIPTSAGSYTFHFTGTIDGEKVDQSFSSGPKTFSDVETGTDIEYPATQPTTTELGQRIDREVPRLNDAIDRAASDASTASSDASGARTLGIVGIVVGVIGIAVAVVALVGARRRTA
jgi:hypothetical protein